MSYYFESALVPPRQRVGLSQWLVRFGFLTLALLLVSALLEQLGGLAGLWWHKVIELPLVLYLYFLLAQVLREDRVGALLAAMPIFLGYALMDVYYLLFGRVFRLSELSEVPELLDVLPWYLSTTLVAAAVVPALVFISFLRPRRPARTVLAVAPMGALMGTMVLFPGPFLQGFGAVSNGIVEWSDAENVRWNGRFTSILYREAKRRSALSTALAYLEEPGYQDGYERKMSVLKAAARPRNVHLLIMEGFVDPSRLANLQLSQDPLHPRFRALLNGGEGDLSKSPVFGGYTPQAEFEVLCGVPALQVLGTIEYNLFSGAPVHCMPGLLSELGYRTVSTQGYKPNFFNKAVATKGLGFEESYFAREYAPQKATYLSTGDVGREKYMFDSVMLDQNLDLVREHLAKSSGQPLLNYVLTIYGHFPYRLDESMRPRVVTAAPPNATDEELLTVINQHYYRSLAVAEHVERLSALDPEALVVLVSDHLPPLKEGVAAYERLGYLNGVPDAHRYTLLSVLQGGRPVAQGQRHHYDTPNLIYDHLTDGAYCAEGLCAERTETQLKGAYMQLMAHAVTEAD